jgi:hypothetical protein
MALVAALSIHCSLGLDESKLYAVADAGVPAFDATGLADGPGVGEPDTGIPSGPDGGACTTDDACTTTHACLHGKCDLGRKTCVYDVCRPSSCTASTCDLAQNVCAPKTTTYKYKVTQFSIGAPLACGRCAAVVHPWLFVNLATGVVAFNVSNPTNASPPQVPVVGLTFVPVRIITSGSRVWMVGAPTGAAQDARLPLAYVDVPTDPFATKLVAQSVLATDNRPAADTMIPYPRAGGGLLLVGPDTAQFASAVVNAPLVPPVAVNTTPLVVAANTTPAVSSGTRLLMSALTSGVATFDLVDNAGTGGSTVGPSAVIGDIADVSTSRAFGMSSDGAVFWATGAHQGEAPQTTTRAVRGYFLVPNATGNIDPSLGLDIEVYDAAGGLGISANAGVVGPVAMLDAKTALVSTQARESDAQTAVQFVKLDPKPIVLKEANGLAPRRQLLPVPVGSFVAAVASNGLAYLIANDPPPNGAGTVFVFDPACAP